MLALLRANRLDRELEAEIQAHLELAERDALRAGSRRQRHGGGRVHEFGSIDSMREAHRDQRSLPWIEHVLRDVRLGLASLVRDPAFTVVALSVLALGIGANAAMFSLVDAVLLKPLPFPQLERIVRVWEAPRPGASKTAPARRTFSIGNAWARPSRGWPRSSPFQLR